MGMGGDEGFSSSKILLVAMFSFSIFAVAEVVGARIANSQSLMADAATMVSSRPFFFLFVFCFLWYYTTVQRIDF